MFLFALVLVEKKCFLGIVLSDLSREIGDFFFFVSNDLHILQTTYITNKKLIINAIYKTK